MTQTASPDATEDWIPPPTHRLSTPDGRVVAYCLYGPAAGRPLIAHDGTPGTRLWGPLMTERAERLGLRVLAFDRPGYGPSTRQPGRSVGAVADDVARLADAQGWDRFGTFGGSGGGPHALACAILLPDRVSRCAAVICPAPYTGDRPDGPAGLSHDSWLAAMSPGNVAEFTSALRSEDEYRELVGRLGAEAVANAERGDVPMPEGYDLPESDLAELRRQFAKRSPGTVERLRAACIDGADGWIDDVYAMLKPWGFDCAELRVPVTVWYGPDDVLVPRAHCEWLLAHLPGAQPREVPGGHMVPDEAMEQIMQWAAG